ncbi:Protein of unknown function [Nitrosospira sp. Nl5]|uniref:DUF2782 domain-containing protein n=1 Tax=Nitrosospira sp. Nl5 TaxID=200120 RepID=UPI0008924385|nr:DUF2782 domain-containing protein [Nitrosospira sp. Nl5]SCY37858.1 Protein of unknown function [Nitrosospira sp. Nl5]
MRLIILVLLLSTALSAAAQSKQPKQPKNLVPIPEVPEPPAIPLPSPGADQEDSELEPQVTITRRGEDKVEEYRINGRLYMIKVTPRIGVPYYLIDRHGDGAFSDGATGGLDQGIRPPMWVIREF